MEEMELIVRKELFPHWIIYVLLISIVVLSVLKYQREFVFENLKTSFFKPPSAVPFTKEEINFFGITNWILLINYFTVTALVIYMMLIFYDSNAYWLMFMPIGYYAFQVLALFFAGLLGGEPKKVGENVLLLNFTTHIIGLIFIPILLAWILNPKFSSYLITILVVVFISLHIVRIIRGIFVSLRNKVLWYYIILYLCGLEIWPVLLVYLLVSPGFKG